MNTSFNIISTLILLCFLSIHAAYCQVSPQETEVYKVVKAALVLDSVPVLVHEKNTYLVLDKFTKTRYSDFFINDHSKNKFTQADKVYLDKQNKELNSINKELLKDVAFISQDSINNITALIDEENDKKEYRFRSGFVYYSIGKPVFTADGKKAFITINHVCHYLLCGESWTLLLGKKNGSWKVLGRKLLTKR